MMAHYAFLDDNNIVTEVIVGKDETDTAENWELFYGNFRSQKCVRTSYNGNIRKNFAGIGYAYDAALDAFIPLQPYPSWLLNTTNCQWYAPTPRPEDGNFYAWDELTLSWILAEMP